MAKQKTKAKEPSYNVVNKQIAIRLEKINKEKN
jgi:hypothetical protein